MLRISKTLELPPDVAVQTSAVLGIRGSGKTNTGVVITEELLKLGTQVIVIDPTDVWWGLKSSKQGNKAGYPIVVLGGAHGDLPLAGENGQLVADFAVENRASVILSQRLTNEQLGQAAGYAPTSSTFERAIATLRKIEAAEGDAKSGGSKAADVFLE